MGSRAKRFAVTLIKPSRYDSDGYVIQWRTSCVPSNSLGCLYALTRDCANRHVLGSDVEIEYQAFDEPNMLVPVDKIIGDMRAADGALLCLVGVQSNQFPRAMHIARRFRAAGIPGRHRRLPRVGLPLHAEGDSRRHPGGDRHRLHDLRGRSGERSL